MSLLNSKAQVYGYSTMQKHFNGFVEFFTTFLVYNACSVVNSYKGTVTRDPTDLWDTPQSNEIVLHSILHMYT